MGSSNKLAPILLKTSFLATILFWLLNFSCGFYPHFMLIFVSVIPISITCSFAISITVMPFYWSNENNMSNDEIFKKYFPYYSITAFVISAYSIIDSGFGIFISAFFITSFITLMQSWIWIFKIPNTIEENNTNLKNEIHDKIQ